VGDPVTSTQEFVSCCGYCGSAIDYCQGHGEDERAEYGFDYDSDQYEARRDVFETSLNFADDWTRWQSHTEADALRATLDIPLTDE